MRVVYVSQTLFTSTATRTIGVQYWNTLRGGSGGGYEKGVLAMHSTSMW